MTELDPTLVAALADLVRGFHALKLRFCLIGALVPQLLLDEPPRRLTNDADAVVVAETLEEFERCKVRLAAFRFQPTALPFRLHHQSGGIVDLLPYSASLTSDNVLALGADLSFNVVGFDQLFDSALTIDAHGLSLPLAPVPLYVLLKLVAYEDRKAPKDLGSIVHCLRHYDEQHDRRYGAEDRGEFVPFEFTLAYLLGCDARRFAHGSLAEVVAGVLTQLEDVDSIGIDLAAREEGWFSASRATW